MSEQSLNCYGNISYAQVLDSISSTAVSFKIFFLYFLLPCAIENESGHKE